MSTHEPPSLQELRARYPYQFAGPYLEIEVAKGWMSIFAKLCADVDAFLGHNKRGFYWSQIKEKFGSARFYHQLMGRHPNQPLDLPTGHNIPVVDDRNEVEVNEHLVRLSTQAEDATRYVCLACGKPGHWDDTAGYYLMVCPEHQAARRQAGDSRTEVEWERLGPENGNTKENS